MAIKNTYFSEDWTKVYNNFLEISNHSKYAKLYLNLIKSRLENQNRIFGTYVERHHIIPKSCGGTDDKTNLLYLTFREHFLAHRLLAKACKDGYALKMKRAIVIMIGKSKIRSGTEKITSAQFDFLKRCAKDAATGVRQSKETIEKRILKLIGKERSEFQKNNISNSLKGWNEKRSEEERISHSKNISVALTGRVLNKETRNKMSKNRIGKKRNEITKERCRLNNIGKKRSEETKERCRDSQNNKWTLISPSGEIKVTENLIEFCKINNIIYSTFIKTLSTGYPLIKGKNAGWKIISKEKRNGN